MKEHAYAQLLKWKLSDCGLWHWQLKPKWLTTCIKSSFRVEASTLPRSNLQDTVTNRCSMLRHLSRSISKSHHLPALQADACTQAVWLFGRMRLSAYTRCDIIAKHRDPQPSGPLLCSCSSHFLTTVFLSLLYYSLTITQSLVCNSVV